MQSKIGYFLMGLSVAYLVQAFLKKKTAETSRSQIAGTQIAGAGGGNVVDLKAWRRDMPDWR